MRLRLRNHDSKIYLKSLRHSQVFKWLMSLSVLQRSSLLQAFNRIVSMKNIFKIHTQLAITCSKLTIETLEQGVKYIQN